jgi:hypothetical protein
MHSSRSVGNDLRAARPGPKVCPYSPRVKKHASTERLPPSDTDGDAARAWCRARRGRPAGAPSRSRGSHLPQTPWGRLKEQGVCPGDGRRRTGWRSAGGRRSLADRSLPARGRDPRFFGGAGSALLAAVCAWHVSPDRDREKAARARGWCRAPCPMGTGRRSAREAKCEHGTGDPSVGARAGGASSEKSTDGHRPGPWGATGERRTKCTPGGRIGSVHERAPGIGHSRSRTEGEKERGKRTSGGSPWTAAPGAIGAAACGRRPDTRAARWRHT